MNLELLKNLCEAPGPPGAEAPVREIFLEALRGFFKETSVDSLGNLILHKPGPGPRVLLDAHLDEVAFMVYFIEPEGFLRVIPLGGVDPRGFYGQRVIVWGKEPLPGVVATIPPHLSEEKTLPPIEEMLIDLALTAEQVRGLVTVGDLVTFYTYFEETETGIMAKALDDRVGLFVIAEAIKKAKEIKADLWVSASVQEEVGLRGAEALIRELPVEAVIAVEGTLAHDFPGVPPHRRLARCGQGPEIRLSDARFLADREFSLALSELAFRRGIPHQIVVKKKGGTNAAAIQTKHGPKRAAAISVPVRYLHSASGVVFKEDIKAAIDLISAFLEEAPSVVADHRTHPTSS